MKLNRRKFVGLGVAGFCAPFLCWFGRSNTLQIRYICRDEAKIKKFNLDDYPKTEDGMWDLYKGISKGLHWFDRSNGESVYGVYEIANGVQLHNPRHWKPCSASGFDKGGMATFILPLNEKFELRLNRYAIAIDDLQKKYCYIGGYMCDSGLFGYDCGKHKIALGNVLNIC